jgi:hypothetical protein
MHLRKPSPSRRLSRKQILTISVAVLASLAAAPLFAQTQNSTWTDTDNNSNWSDANNWNPNGSPNNGSNGFTDYNVTIGAPAPTDLNVNVTIDSATISSGGVLDILGDQILTLNDNVDDNGTITINSN